MPDFSLTIVHARSIFKLSKSNKLFPNFQSRPSLLLIERSSVAVHLLVLGRHSSCQEDIIVYSCSSILDSVLELFWYLQIVCVQGQFLRRRHTFFPEYFGKVNLHGKMAVVDESLPEELEEVCTEFHQRLQEAKQKLKPLCSHSREELHEEIGEDLVEHASLDLSVAFAVNSLFWCYLCTQGVNTAEHPIKHELDRIKEHMARVQSMKLERRGRTTTVNKDAAKRVVQSGIWTPDKQKQEKNAAQERQHQAQERALAKRSRSPSPSCLRGASEKRRKT